MTIEDANEFCRQADDIGWQPRVIIIGGEPTLHPQFEDFVELAREWSFLHPENFVQVYSNAYTEKSRSKLIMVEKTMNASINRDTWKEGGAVTGTEDFWHPEMFVSPVDAGLPPRGPCYQHASQICGVSVDHEGYAPCAPGGAIAGLLGIGRTKRLADLFDEEKAAALTADLCRHCGYGFKTRARQSDQPELGDEIVRYERFMSKCETRFGSPMSPTWVGAFEGRK